MPAGAISSKHVPFDTGQLEIIHTLLPAEVYQTLGTPLPDLAQDEVERRLQYFGRNSIRQVKGKPLWLKFLANFIHLMAVLLWLGGQRLAVVSVGYGPRGQVLPAGGSLEAGQPFLAADNEDLHRLLVAASLCNNARLLPPNPESPRWTVLGDPTEAALRVAADLPIRVAL